MRTMLPQSARNVALDILLRVQGNKKSTLSEIASAVLNQSTLDERDRSLAMDIVFGVLRHRLIIDHTYKKFLKARCHLNPEIREILRIGTYQILFHTRVPHHAAVNEAVKTAGQLFSRREAGFVNAILRKVTLCSLDEIKFAGEGKNPAQASSLKYSFPPWMVKKLLSQYGVSKTRQFLSFSNEHPPLTLRVNTLKITVPEFMEWLRQNQPEVETATCRYSGEGLIVNGLPLKAEWQPLQKGWVYIQDEASQMVSLFANPAQGMRIVDYCSAPGGKLTHLAALVQNKAEFISFDINWKRLKKVEENCKRLGVSNVRMEVLSRETLQEIKKEPVDIVLTDVPCSGLGIIRRHPDLKWKRSERMLKSMPENQFEILEKASELVKIGGIIVYSTCTVLEEENQGVVRKFLKRHPEFELERKSGALGDAARTLITPEGFLITFPPETKTDGFFAARLKRISASHRL